MKALDSGSWVWNPRILALNPMSICTEVLYRAEESSKGGGEPAEREGSATVGCVCDVEHDHRPLGLVTSRSLVIARSLVMGDSNQDFQSQTARKAFRAM